MQRYCELLRRKLDELRMDVHTFFRVSHVWCFGTDPDLNDDVAQFRLHSVIPRYVVRYLDNLYQGEH